MSRLISSSQVLLSLSAITVLLFSVSLLMGETSISAIDVLKGLFPFVFSIDEKTVTIVQEIRLPRALLAFLVGACLGLSGAALQGLLRNPLAEPGVIGISAAAGLGAVTSIYWGLSGWFQLATPLMAMMGAFSATALLYLIAARQHSTLTLILAGVAIGSLSVSLTTLVMNLSPNPFALSEMVFWLLGSVKDRSFNEVAFSAPFALFGALLILSAARSLDALTLGEETASSLGFNLSTIRLRIIVGTTLAVGSAVSVAGSIGFVGLVVPHLLRPLIGHTPSKLLIPSAVGGGALILAADLCVRVAPGEHELMLGVVTSIIGAPFFIFLILQLQREAL